jgi:hypothetical protein
MALLDSKFFGGEGDTFDSSFFGGANMLTSGISTALTSRAYGRHAAVSAKSARQAAVEAPQKAAWQITRLRLQKRSILSSQRFTAALAGIQIQGTPTDVMQLTEQEILLDEENIWREGQLEKQQYELEAEAYDAAARASKRGEKLGIAGAAVGGAALLMSDARCKRDIRPVTGAEALAKVRALTAYKYTYAGDDIERIGLLAQEVEAVLPAAVAERDGRKMVDLYAVQALLIAALREAKGVV